MPTDLQWHLVQTVTPPEWLIADIQQLAPQISGHYLAQLLWQRGICDPQTIPGFLDPNHYQPTSPSAFGAEMTTAIQRLIQARDRNQKVVIWGDFDADGITATAVLWDGLGQFFAQNHSLTYTIPNRLTGSHGLNQPGIERLAAQGYQLIVTCDTGSTNLSEIEYARELGLDVIITDHHTLPPERPPVTAIINPRYLPADHPLAHLSGVAVAYKLVEALYTALPQVPQQPLNHLLDLVAIGLIADLVALKGDCRYLAQHGIQHLQQQLTQRTRPGIATLLELCKRNGDRPTDISFGLGPRINAVSRIHGEASFCVELLTSTDPVRCRQLAEETELANTRRKSLQKDVLKQVTRQLEHLDLSITSVIVLSDPQWPVGVLGLVAGQIAQTYGRPTILLNEETVPKNGEVRLARGSARSVNQIDLYQLVDRQAPLLTSFGGHPFAAGLSLPIANIPLLVEGINQHARQQQATEPAAVVQADLAITLAELATDGGRSLFKELKLLEPCGMGNPVPKLLIRNCWFEQVWNKNICDRKGNKVQYIKTTFQICDTSFDRGFPGLWWGHYKEEIPPGPCDAVVELDFNAYEKRYEVRLEAVRPAAENLTPTLESPIVDWRQNHHKADPHQDVLVMNHCPNSWSTVQHWAKQAQTTGKTLAVAYEDADAPDPVAVWKQLVGMAKSLARREKSVSLALLEASLNIGPQALQMGLESLGVFGFAVHSEDQQIRIKVNPSAQGDASVDRQMDRQQAILQFVDALREEQFQQQYFQTVSVDVMGRIIAERQSPDREIR
ncbi:single-stranded-DNA-specific exonuclease RecJ [Acaryochloris sp. IP29b_bin.137]|uniref:single-stranded-DNA-specific exonuclease RecJ n=1 Tax=Acaryochloris sp. IP29b_bin.137 TaxID=2969217 RepID=UPI002614D7AE|nr:single-stranded-DNA-specific exonuclease RecJ [Acaryochloris sp. IP29b_bin.137]